jgi:hypothetical protein
MRKENYISYTIHSSNVYSDGKRTGGPHHTPDLAKCPACGAIFFRHNLMEREARDWEEARYAAAIGTPELDDYRKALDKGLPKNRDEEIEARTALWRALNDKVRYGGSFSDDELKLWLDNCDLLLPLVIAKHRDKVWAIDWDKGLSDSERKELDDTLITCYELGRNTGNFEQSAVGIAELPETHSRLKKQFIKECEKKNPFVFEIELVDD